MGGEIRHCMTSDGVRIAYDVTGAGAPFVMVPAFDSYLGAEAHNPVLSEARQALARQLTLIRYDARGAGLSERKIDGFSLDARVADLAAVVDDMKLSRFILHGSSDGGVVAIAYAARNPKRVARLVLNSTYASGPSLARLRHEISDAVVALIRRDWQLAAAAVYCILCPGSDEAEDEIAGFREAMDHDYTAMLVKALTETDVDDLLAQITAPTLVLHGRDDRSIPFQLGLRLATAIPNARFYPHEGSHRMSDPAIATEINDAIRGFLASRPRKTTEETAS